MSQTMLSGAAGRLALRSNVAALPGTGGVSVSPLAGKVNPLGRYYASECIATIQNHAAEGVTIALGAQFYANTGGTNLVGLGLLFDTDEITIPAGETAAFNAPRNLLAMAARFGTALDLYAALTPASGDANVSVFLETVQVKEV